MESEELINLQDRLRGIIHNTCNTIGCKNCGLKWETGCSATELQGQIQVIEMDNYNNKKVADGNYKLHP